LWDNFLMSMVFSSLFPLANRMTPHE